MSASCVPTRSSSTPSPSSRQKCRRRAEGECTWSAQRQARAPSARRLHFWRLVGDGVELDRVGTHDADI